MGRAREAVRDRGDETIVLVRRHSITGITWHMFRSAHVTAVLSGAPDDRPLSELLILDPVTEVPTAEEEGDYGVWLEGKQVVSFGFGPTAGTTLGDPAPPSPAAPGPPEVESGAPARWRPRLWSRRRDHGAPRASAPDETEIGEDLPARHRAQETGTTSGRTRTSFPDIEAPNVVGIGEVFPVTVSLRLEGSDHTTGAVTVDDESPDESVLEYDVVLAGSFTPAQESTPRGKVRLDHSTGESQPFRTNVRFDDAPDDYDPEVGAWPAPITALFSHRGRPVGHGRREIWVNASGSPAVADAVASSRADPEIEWLGAEGPEADLVLRIERADPAAGLFDISVSSPLLPEPSTPVTRHLGNPARYAAELINDVGLNVSNAVADEVLEAFGAEVADLLGDGTTAALADVISAKAAQSDEAATVLIATNEASIPWELALVSVDGAPEAFLGSLADVGRWPLEHMQRLRADPLDVRGLGVMVGHYEEALAVAPLPRAEEEGRELAETYDAEAVDASPDSYDQMLKGRFDSGFEFQALHFAGHGESTPGRGTYLMYSDGGSLTVRALRRADVAAGRPSFLFVNACQVGTAEVVVGKYAGVAGHALAGGFRGYVAPLWSVADDEAKKVSLGFYEAAARGETVAGYLRTVRERFRETPEHPAHTTWMAYVYYGHPALALAGPRRREG